MKRMLAALALACLAGHAAHAQAPPSSCILTIKWQSQSAALPASAQSGVVQITSSAVPGIGYTGETWSFPVSAGSGTVTTPNQTLLLTLTFTPTGGTIPTQSAVIQQTAGATCSAVVLPGPGGPSPLILSS